MLLAGIRALSIAAGGHCRPELIAAVLTTMGFWDARARETISRNRPSDDTSAREADRLTSKSFTGMPTVREGDVRTVTVIIDRWPSM